MYLVIKYMNMPLYRVLYIVPIFAMRQFLRATNKSYNIIDYS